MTFGPFDDYDPARDVFDRTALVRRVRGAPPGAVCWVFVAPRRGGKTWTLRALEHHLGARAQVVDVRGAVFQAPSALERGDTVLVDEPGYTLREAGRAFVSGCRALQARGVRVVVAATPAEYEALGACCQAGQGDVAGAVLHAPRLTADGASRIAGRGVEGAALLGRVPEAWRATPFLLELCLYAIELDPALADAAAVARRAISLAESEYDYMKFAWCQGLTEPQRAVVRACLRGAAPTDHAERDLLERAGVLREGTSGRFQVADPILAATLAPLRIHHVSDVHVGPKSYEAVDMKSSDPAPREAMGPAFVRERYIEHLRECGAAGTAPHVLVCSGDCVEYANETEQYVDFASWLVDAEALLASHPAVPVEKRTLLVGGNHDVDWKLAAHGNRDRHRAFAAVAGARPHPGLHIAPERRAVAEVSFPEAGVSFVLLGSAEYGGTVTHDPLRAGVLAALDATKTHAPTSDPALLKRMEALRARLLDDPLMELRSVLDALCPDTTDKERREKIEEQHWKVMRVDPGFVDDRDLARLRAHDWPHAVKIAVLHHPVSPLPDTEVARFGGLLNAGAVKEALLAKGFHLVLHGHVHRGWFAQERQWGADGAPRTLAVASAPTLGSRETAKDQGFNEIEVARDYGDDGRAHYRVAVRRYVRDNATWRADGAEMALDPIPA